MLHPGFTYATIGGVVQYTPEEVATLFPLHMRSYEHGRCDRQGQDDYRFVYVGPSGSFTGLHHDVLNR